MKAVRQARLELSGGSTPDQLKPGNENTASPGRKAERQKETPGITQRPLATIHKHLGTPAKVVCGGPLHRVQSPETSERCRTVRAPCNNTL